MKNSILHSSPSSKGSIKKAACYLIFAALCVAPLFGGEYFLPLYILVYLDFLKNSRNLPRDILSKQCLVGFLISITVTLLFAIYHYDALKAGSGEAKYILIGLGWFAPGFMIIDSARFQFSFYGLKKHVLALMLILASSVSVAFLVGKKIIEMPYIIERALSLQIKNIYWSDLNPNHVDNIVLYVVLLLIWSLSSYASSRVSVWLIAIANMSLMVFLFYVSGTRGGVLGAITAALIMGVIYFVRRNKKVYLLYFAAVLGIVCTVGVMTSKRIAHGITSISTLATNAPSTQELFTNSSLGSEKNRKAILEILNEPPSDGRVASSRQIARLCWPNNTLDRADNFKGLDQNTVFRYLMFWEGVKIWLKEPYFGHGYYSKSDIVSNYENSEPCVVGYFSHLHNHYTNILIYYGAVGLIAFILLMIYSLYMFDRMCRSNGDKLLYLPTFYFLYLLVENNFDLTFDRNSDLLSVLFCVLMLFSISTSCDDNHKKTIK